MPTHIDNINTAKKNHPNILRGVTVKPGTHMRTKPFTNHSQTKCVYLWMGLQTCAAPSANTSHTVRRKLRFVGFLYEHNGNWVCRVSCVPLTFVENKFTVRLVRTVRKPFG